MTVSFAGEAVDNLANPTANKATVTIKNDGDNPITIDMHSSVQVLAVASNGQIASPVPENSTFEFHQVTLQPGESQTVPAQLPRLECSPSGSVAFPSGHYLVAPIVDIVTTDPPNIVRVVGTAIAIDAR